MSLNNNSDKTYLLLSANAAVRVEYFPPEPTVIAPEGMAAATTSLTKKSEDAIAAARRMVTWDGWGKLVVDVEGILHSGFIGATFHTVINRVYRRIGIHGQYPGSSRKSVWVAGSKKCWKARRCLVSKRFRIMFTNLTITINHGVDL